MKNRIHPRFCMMVVLGLLALPAIGLGPQGDRGPKILDSLHFLSTTLDQMLDVVWSTFGPEMEPHGSPGITSEPADTADSD